MAYLPFFRDGIFYDRVTRRLYGTSGANLDEQGNSHGTLPFPRAGLTIRSTCTAGRSFTEGDARDRLAE
jgi:hypothetical protein